MHGWSGTRRLRAPSSSYLGKYLQKGETEGGKSGRFPRGLRIFAAVVRKSARSVLPSVSIFWFRLSALTAWIRMQVVALRDELNYEFCLSGGLVDVHEGWRWRRLLGGGWRVSWCDEVWYLRSEWSFCG